MQRGVVVQTVPNQSERLLYLGHLLQKIPGNGTTAVGYDNEQYVVVGFWCYIFSLY